MLVYKKNNTFVSYLIILVGLFILIVFTKDQIVKIQENNDLRETYAKELIEKKKELGDLNARKVKIANSSEDIGKYSLEIKEDEIIEYLYSYIERTNNNDGITIVKNISISEPKNTEIGFKETIINLNVRVPNEEKMKDLLDFLISEKSKYKFIINSFSFPYGKVKGAFNISIPLKILHK